MDLEKVEQLRSQLPRTLVGDWSCDSFWSFIENEPSVLGSLVKAWPKLESPIKMRALLACLGVDPRYLLQVEPTLQALLDLAREDSDEWVVCIGGLIHKRLYEKESSNAAGEHGAEPPAKRKKEAPILDRTLDTAVNRISKAARDAFTARATALKGIQGSGDVDAVCEFDSISLYPLSAQYMCKSLQPPTERFRVNRHFKPHENAMMKVKPVDEGVNTYNASTASASSASAKHDAQEQHPKHAPAHTNNMHAQPSSSTIHNNAVKSNNAQVNNSRSMVGTGNPRPPSSVSAMRGAGAGRGGYGALASTPGMYRPITAAPKRPTMPGIGGMRMSGIHASAPPKKQKMIMLSVDDVRSMHAESLAPEKPAKASRKRALPPPPPPAKTAASASGVPSAASSTSSGPNSSNPLGTIDVLAAGPQKKSVEEQKQVPPPPAVPEKSPYELLLEKSNILTDEDKETLALFFQRINPVPGRMLAKLRIHEAEVTNKETGETHRIVYYVNIDYSSWQWKMTQKKKENKKS